MTWTPEHSILLAREICGYEVQTSPRGKHYVIEDGRTRPLPDFSNDPGETLTTLEAWLKVGPGRQMDIEFWQDHRQFYCRLEDNGKQMTVVKDSMSMAIAACLYFMTYQAVSQRGARRGWTNQLPQTHNSLNAVHSPVSRSGSHADDSPV